MLQPILCSEQEKMVLYVQPRVCPELELDLLLGVSTELDKDIAILIAIRYGAEICGCLGPCRKALINASIMQKAYYTTE